MSRKHGGAKAKARAKAKERRPVFLPAAVAKAGEVAADVYSATFQAALDAGRPEDEAAVDAHRAARAAAMDAILSSYDGVPSVDVMAAAFWVGLDAALDLA